MHTLVLVRRTLHTLSRRLAAAYLQYLTADISLVMNAMGGSRCRQGAAVAAVVSIEITPLPHGALPYMHWQQELTPSTINRQLKIIT
jgi:hypothetical protein